jgi:tRNA/rRNA methyltransferase
MKTKEFVKGIHCENENPLRPEFHNIEISVVLFETEATGNIGSIARSMKNFALKNLIIINPKCPITTETYGFAMHGKEILERAKILTISKVDYIKNLQDLFKEYHLVVATSGKLANYKNIARVPIFVDEFEFPSLEENEIFKMAIIFGRESVGLTVEEIQFADLLMTIPANPDYPIMNLSHAAAVIFFTLYKKMHFIERGQIIPATVIQRKILQDKIESVAKSIEDEEIIQELYQNSLKNAIGRSFCSRNEINHLIRFFDKVYQRINKLDEKDIQNH